MEKLIDHSGRYHSGQLQFSKSTLGYGVQIKRLIS